MMGEDQFLSQFFRPFSFGRLFDDDRFTSFFDGDGGFGQFDPHHFATNFS